jgi:Putative beta barrel porin-7 (BBP7)
MSFMKRLWTALLTSLLTVSPSLAQSMSAPQPRPLTPDPQSSAVAPSAPSAPSAPAGAAPAAPAAPDAGPINPMTGMPMSGPESLGETFESGPVRARRAIWGSVDYIFWTGKGDTPPALVTTSPAGSPLVSAGVLNNGSTVLFGNTALNDEARSGVKFELGGWLDANRTIGLQAGGFLVGDSSAGTIFTSNGSMILARPFTSTTTGPASQLVSFTDQFGNVVSGSVAPVEKTSIDGFDVAIRSLGCCGPCWRFDTLIGYRYLNLVDRLGIGQELVVGPRGAVVGAPPGAVVTTNDEFDAYNTFHGAEVGVTGEYRFLERWTLEGTIKASAGYLNQRSNITGFTTTNNAGVVNTVPGGLLALPGANFGRLERSEGQLVPELNLNLAYEITDRIRFHIGYSFLYMDNVFRAGNQIDTTPGSTSPVRPFQTELRTDYYLHGVNAGLEFRF